MLSMTDTDLIMGIVIRRFSSVPARLLEVARDFRGSD
jgi:hypothetical protein